MGIVVTGMLHRMIIIEVITRLIIIISLDTNYLISHSVVDQVFLNMNSSDVLVLDMTFEGEVICAYTNLLHHSLLCLLYVLGNSQSEMPPEVGFRNAHQQFLIITVIILFISPSVLFKSQSISQTHSAVPASISGR